MINFWNIICWILSYFQQKSKEKKHFFAFHSGVNCVSTSNVNYGYIKLTN